MSKDEPELRRRYQVPLRTSLVLFTLACIGFGLFLNHARSNQKRIDAIVSVGGVIDYAYHFEKTDIFNPDRTAASPDPAWVQTVFGAGAFRSPHRIFLPEDARVTDEFVAKNLSSMPSLKYLIIKSPNLSDKSLTTIASLSNLSILELDCPKITADGIRRLRPLKSLSAFRSIRNGNSDFPFHSVFCQTRIETEALPLGELCQFLSQHHPEFRFECDKDVDTQTPITVTIVNKSLGEALDIILAPHALGYVFDRDVIRITTIETQEKKRKGYLAMREVFPDLNSLDVDW